MYETITTRNERATRYSRHVQRERIRRRILMLQWVALCSIAAWALALGGLILWML